MNTVEATKCDHFGPHQYRKPNNNNYLVLFAESLVNGTFEM